MMSRHRTGCRTTSCRLCTLGVALVGAGVVALDNAGQAVAQGMTEVVAQCTDAALRQAIATVAPGGTVDFGCDGTIIVNPALGAIQTLKSYTLDGTGHHVTISGGDQTNLFFISGGGTVTMRQLTLSHGKLGQDAQHGFASFGGAAVAVANTEFVADHVTFTDNQVFGGYQSGIGGAVDVFGPHGGLVITGSQFVNNAVECDSTCTDGGGGAIGFRGGQPAVISGSSFSGNSDLGGDGGGALAATFAPGAATHEMGPITITDSLFQANTSATMDDPSRPPRGGGAVVSFNHPLTLTRDTFTGNAAKDVSAAIGGASLGPSSGGAIRIADSFPGFLAPQPASITDSSFSGNTAGSVRGGGSGGAVSVGDQQLQISGSTFSHNLAPNGGALDIFGDHTTVANSRLLDNTASGNVNGTGGAVWTAGPTPFTGTWVLGNTPDGCYTFKIGSHSGQIIDGGGNLERPGASCGFAPDPATQVQVVLTPMSVPANGSATASATATVTDARGGRVPGDTMTFVSSDPGDHISPPVDNGDGTYSVTITASTQPAVATITATDLTANPRVSGTADLAEVATTPPAASTSAGAGSLSAGAPTELAMTGTRSVPTAAIGIGALALGGLLLAGGRKRT